LQTAANRTDKSSAKDYVSHFPNLKNKSAEQLEQMASNISTALKNSDLLSPEEKQNIFSHLRWTSEETPLKDIVQGLTGMQIQPKPKGSQKAAEAVNMAYLPASDKVLVSRDNQLKLVSREAGGRTDFFEEPVHFGNQIHNV